VITRAPRREVRVKIAEHAVGSGHDALTTVGLGSCVAIALHDPDARVGGLAHILLPSATLCRASATPAKFAETAVPLLLREMATIGAGPRVTAKVVGGASMFVALLPSDGVSMGRRNVEATLRALAAAGVPVVAQDTGGEHGRSVTLDVHTGDVSVRSLKAGSRVL
jgi:chemotaxis protein CheD